MKAFVESIDFNLLNISTQGGPADYVYSPAIIKGIVINNGKAIELKVESHKRNLSRQEAEQELIDYFKDLTRQGDLTFEVSNVNQNTKLIDSALSTRALNHLREFSDIDIYVTTLKQLSHKSKKDLWHTRGIGKGTLKEIADLLNSVGLKLI